MSFADFAGHHVGRSFQGHHIEDKCPCPQEPCGLVAWDRADPDCIHHGTGTVKTIRQGHAAEKCPGRPSRSPTTTNFGRQL